MVVGRAGGEHGIEERGERASPRRILPPRMHSPRSKQRYAKIDEVKAAALAALAEGERPKFTADQVSGEFFNLEYRLVRERILEGHPRIDGRDTKTVRPINIRTGVLARTHGSALFTRGETQALVVTTLGTGRDAQIIDGLTGERKEPFMLHYNFPPFSVGETGMMGSPKRREIGHGNLAKRGVKAVMPDMEKFPYVIRVVSEILESNGSSSMASVCGTSLALMDAGVPIKAPVAGVAMGLVKEGERFQVLTDILGDEDHLGDMDFKVAGTKDGITALQMDIKITSITREIMKVALDQARAGRLHILGEMNKVLAKPRENMSEWAPTIITLKIDPEKIRDVIGKGGAVIRQITEETGTSIDIENDGTVKIASVQGAAGREAQRRIELITADVEVGRIYEGRVARLMDFGAFVTILPGPRRLGAYLADLRRACRARRRQAEGRRCGARQGSRSGPAGSGPPVDAQCRRGLKSAHLKTIRIAPRTCCGDARWQPPLGLGVPARHRSAENAASGRLASPTATIRTGSTARFRRARISFALRTAAGSSPIRFRRTAPTGASTRCSNSRIRASSAIWWSLWPGEWPEGSVQRKVGRLLRERHGRAAIDAAGVAPLQPEFARIAAIANVQELQAEFAHLQSIGVEAPLQLGQMQDFKDSTRVIAVAQPKRPWAAESRLLSEERADLQAARAAYVAACRAHARAARRLRRRPPTRESKAVMALETRLAQASMSDVEQRDPRAIYHPDDSRARGGARAASRLARMLRERGASGDRVAQCGDAGVLRGRGPGIAEHLAGRLEDVSALAAHRCLRAVSVGAVRG